MSFSWSLVIRHLCVCPSVGSSFFKPGNTLFSKDIYQYYRQSEYASITLKNLCLPNQWTTFDQTLHTPSLGKRGSSFFSIERQHPFFKGDNEVANSDSENALTTFYKSSPEPLGWFYPNLRTKHLWVKGKFVQMKVTSFS